MVLSTLVFVLGFAVATLLALAVAPFVWGRASRLTRREIEASLPLSIKDVEADRDELRAEFAVERRRLESDREHLRDKESALRVEMGRQVGQIDLLNRDIAERDERIDGLKSESAARADRIGSLTDTLTSTRGALEAERETVADLNGRLESLERSFFDLQAQSDSQRVEIVALKTQTANLKEIIAERDQAISGLKSDLADERSARQSALSEIETLKDRIGALREAIAERDRAVDSQRADHEAAAARLRDRIEEKAVEVRDLQAQITRQVAQSVRDTKQIEALESKLRTSVDDLARMDSQMREVNRKVDASGTAAARNAEQDERKRAALIDELETLRASLRDKEALTLEQQRTIARLTRDVEDQTAKIADLTTRLNSAGTATRAPQNTTKNGTPSGAAAARAPSSKTPSNSDRIASDDGKVLVLKAPAADATRDGDPDASDTAPTPAAATASAKAAKGSKAATRAKAGKRAGNDRPIEQTSLLDRVRDLRERAEATPRR